MGLDTDIQIRLNIGICNFLGGIADHYSIKAEDLINFVKTTSVRGEELQQNFTCLHVLTRGINKGKNCTGKAGINGYCKKHQNAALGISSVLPGAKTKKVQPMTKTQQNIIDWLNTAVPQEKTVLKKNSKGYIHEETDMIFDEQFIVIGKLNNDEIIPIEQFEIDICEKRGWKYDFEKAMIIEDSSISTTE